MSARQATRPALRLPGLADRDVVFAVGDVVRRQDQITPTQVREGTATVIHIDKRGGSHSPAIYLDVRLHPTPPHDKNDGLRRWNKTVAVLVRRPSDPGATP